MGLFSDIDDFLFGPPGECSGVLGDAVNYVTENPGKSIAIVVATIATGGLATAAIGPAAAAVGSTGLLGAASTGTAISSLSGAALQSASLAALSGGSVAAGGGGIATTVAAAGIAGRTVGGSVARKVVNS